jgi:hypothetical protein
MSILAPAGHVGPAPSFFQRSRLFSENPDFSHFAHPLGSGGSAPVPGLRSRRDSVVKYHLRPDVLRAAAGCGPLAVVMLEALAVAAHENPSGAAVLTNDDFRRLIGDVGKQVITRALRRLVLAGLVAVRHVRISGKWTARIVFAAEIVSSDRGTVFQPAPILEDPAAEIMIETTSPKGRRAWRTVRIDALEKVPSMPDSYHSAVCYRGSTVNPGEALPGFTREPLTRARAQIRRELEKEAESICVASAPPPRLHPPEAGAEPKSTAGPDLETSGKNSPMPADSKPAFAGNRSEIAQETRGASDDANIGRGADRETCADFVEAFGAPSGPRKDSPSETAPAIVGGESPRPVRVSPERATLGAWCDAWREATGEPWDVRQKDRGLSKTFARFFAGDVELSRRAFGLALDSNFIRFADDPPTLVMHERNKWKAAAVEAIENEDRRRAEELALSNQARAALEEAKALEDRPAMDAEQARRMIADFRRRQRAQNSERSTVGAAS